MKYQLQFISESVYNCLYEYISAHRCLYIHMENNVNKTKSLARFVLVLCVGVPAYMLENPGGLVL